VSPTDPTETCKRTCEITVPLAEVQAETEKVVAEFQQKAKMPGFRPGKVPLAVVRKRFHEDIRQHVVEHIVPKAFRREADANGWQVVGNPAVKHIDFEEGKPMVFRAEYEVAPEFELGDYRAVEVPYDEPSASGADVEARVEAMREAKAEYVNIDPRPLGNGDHAVLSLRSIEGVEGEPVEVNETVIEIGGKDTMAGFTETLLGASPGDSKEVEIDYPENYGHERLAGKKVKFAVAVKGLRRKELPELSDEFAKDVGDFQSLEELRDSTRRAVLREKEIKAQGQAKNAIVEKLIASHSFPVPEAWVEAQIKSQAETRLTDLAMHGVDVSQLKLDWHKLRDAFQEEAVKQVKASLILAKIADRESIETMIDEVDREVHRLSKQMREPVAALRLKMEKDGSIGRIAQQIRTNKVLNFLFEQARKVPTGAA
jgi:trigger factor